MGNNSNVGQDNSVVVFGNPESFKKLIKNHGQLCKIKQALACPCMGNNFNSPETTCEICNGEGYTYTYQRRFLVVDEESRYYNKNKLCTYWSPILSVEKVQNVTSQIQGGIVDFTVSSFSGDLITLSEEINSYEKKRVTYNFDGWTYVEEELLTVDETNKLMYVSGTVFDSGYQSSNPLNAFADISKIVKIWNKKTGAEITNYSYEGKTISTSQPIESGQMYIEYYYADLTQIITTEIDTKDDNEKWTHELASGMTKMAFYPYWDISKGDLITIAATVLWKNEIFTHVKDIDKLWEIEIFKLNNVIIDDLGNKYYIDTDYILQGRHIKWIGNKPKLNAKCSVRYGYKPSFIVFDDNPQPNNLENKAYPKICLVKSWSKVNKDDISKLIQ